MNERIRELAKKSGFVLWQDESWNPGNVVDWSSDYDAELEKFAELIVRECFDVLMKESERLHKLESEEKDDLRARDFEVAAEKCVDNVEALREHFFGF
jgi:hypothetical protein